MVQYLRRYCTVCMFLGKWSATLLLYNVTPTRHLPKLNTSTIILECVRENVAALRDVSDHRTYASCDAVLTFTVILNAMWMVIK